MRYIHQSAQWSMRAENEDEGAPHQPPVGPRAHPPAPDRGPGRGGGGAQLLEAEPRPLLWLAKLSKLAKLANICKLFCKFLAGSFSAVSKRNFARKYAFDRIFQDLKDFAPLQCQNFSKKSA